MALTALLLVRCGNSALHSSRPYLVGYLKTAESKGFSLTDPTVVALRLLCGRSLLDYSSRLQGKTTIGVRILDPNGKVLPRSAPWLW